MGFEVPVRVYIEDTDAGGIVFYGELSEVFERARTDFLRTIGVEQSVTIENNLLLSSVMSLLTIEHQRGLTIC